jgi:hypothetical protein
MIDGRCGALLALCALLAACSDAAKQPVRQPTPTPTPGPPSIEAKLQEARAGHVDPNFIPYLTVQTQKTMEVGDFQAALQTAEPLVQMSEIVHGPDAIKTAPNLEVLADIYCNLGRCAESVPLLERARAIYKSGGAPTKVAHIRTLNSLGASWDLLGQPARAEPVLKESLALSEAQFGANSPQVGVACWLLVDTYTAQGKTAAATAMKARANKLMPVRPPSPQPKP